MERFSVTQRLHEDEVHIDADLVRELIRAQLPQLGHLDVRLVAAPGTDNVVFRLGEELAVRLPRKPAAVASLLVEREWLRRLAAQLPLAAPEPIASGEPSDAYPFPWLVCTWVSGVPLAPGGANPNDASVLAEFVLALQSLDTAGGPQIPPGRRAGPVVAYDATARAALETVRALKTAGRLSPDLVDEKRAAAVWSAAVDAPPWHGPDVWVHRDLMASNLLTRGGRLKGVIDFGGLAVGDPAGDVMVAFHVFDSPPSRLRFRAELGTDDQTWARARGWALIQGLEALVYYIDSHPGMVAMARHVIRQTLDSAD
jgi:aminoglycoside phosphotransferase (APT) family kinase protein